jgi:hypothetical protein
MVTQLLDFAGWVPALYFAGALYTIVGWFLPPKRHPVVHHQPHAADVVCENVEAIAMALVIALTVKEFVAEAFVIPTGSMEPTILGTDRGKRQGDRLLALVEIDGLHPFEVQVALPTYRCGACNTEAVEPRDAVVDDLMKASAQAFRAAQLAAH